MAAEVSSSVFIVTNPDPRERPFLGIGNHDGGKHRTGRRKKFLELLISEIKRKPSDK